MKIIKYVLVVISLIIGILVLAFYSQARRNRENLGKKIKSAQAISEMNEIRNAIYLLYDEGVFDISPGEDFVELLSGKYYPQEVIRDPWHQKYRLNDRFDLISNGHDMILGSEDDIILDIGSKASYMRQNSD